MKYLIVSDIHGCLPALEKVLSFFEENHYDQLVLLGDILNYGPRNGVPEGLDAMGITEKLNPLACKILAVRGNCDSEVDQMLLSYPCLADYALLCVGGKRVFLTHGHRFGVGNVPADGYEAHFSGHTHVWSLEKTEGKVICNTGSVTFPKEGKEPTFATIDEDLCVRMRGLDGSILKEVSL